MADFAAVHSRLREILLPTDPSTSSPATIQRA